MIAPALPQPKLAELIALASEPSSDRRRELLREITDLFFMAPATHGVREMDLFDQVLSTLSADMENEVQAELAERMSEAQQPPRGLLRTLACGPLTVAEPLLTRSVALTQDDLLHVAATRGQGHLRAISGRADLTHAVSDMIVERGDDHTLNVLLRNDQADLSRQASEKAVDRAVVNPDLHAAVVGRQTLPLDLLNEMYFVVEARLREAITAKNATLDPATLDAALAAGRKRLAARDGALPADFAAAEAHVRQMNAQGSITPASLVGFLRKGERTRFLVALCELTQIDFHTARRIVDRQDLDALAIVCKAADFDRALFLTFTILILNPGEAMARAEAYGRLYADLPKDAALRTMRFWKMRRTSGEVAAA